MLVSFSVSDFRSFGEKAMFSLVAGKRAADHVNHLVLLNDVKTAILRTAVVYGANGAGKSNLYRAIKFVRDLVVEDMSKGSSIVCPCFAFGTLHHPGTSFRVVFAAEEGVYAYEVGIQQGAISQERLDKVVSGVFKNVFERSYDKVSNDTHVSIGYDFRNEMPEKVIALAVVGAIKTRTFLSVVNENIPNEIHRGKLLSSVINWFEQLLFIAPNEQFGGSLVREYQKSDFHDFAKSILKDAAGVDDIMIDSRELEEGDVRRVIPKESVESAIDRLRQDELVVVSSSSGSRGMIERQADNRYRMSLLRAMHDLDGGITGSLDISDESDGTKRLVDLLPAFYAVKSQGRVCIIDEMDRSIHALLMRSFLRLFLNGSDRGQLIFTTHESSLLDIDIFRRDEIWFAEKDLKGMTRLYSLNDYRLRTSRTIRDYYLQGRYGATPVDFGGQSAANEVSRSEVP